MDACPNMAGVQASASECEQVIEPPPPAKPVVAADTSLTLSPSATALDYGQQLTLRGVLRAEGSSYSEGGRAVYLERREPSGSFVRFATVQTDGDGGYSSYAFAPTRSYSYGAVFAGTAGAELAKPSTSDPEFVGVRAVVKHTTSTKDLMLGKARTLSGSVAPTHPGKQVKVEVVRRNYGVVVATLSPTLDSSSYYKVLYKPTKTGTYEVRVSFAGDADHLAGTGPTRTFKVFGSRR